MFYSNREFSETSSGYMQAFALDGEQSGLHLLSNHLQSKGGIKGGNRCGVPLFSFFGLQRPVTFSGGK